MTPRHVSSCAFALACALVLAVATPRAVRGQDPIPVSMVKRLIGATPEEVGAQAAAIMTRIGDSTAAYQHYRAQLVTASAEDSLVLRLQMAASVDDFIAALRDLAAAVPPPAATDAPGSPRERIAAFYALVTPRIWDTIAENRAEIDALRARRPAVPPAGRLELEDKVAYVSGRLDGAFTFGLEHLRTLASLGPDTTADQDTYRTLLAERADELAGRIDLELQRVQTLKSRLKGDPANGDYKLLSAATKQALDTETKSFGVVLDLMDQVGLPTERHRAKLVAVTRDLASGLLDARVTATLTRRVATTVTSWLRANGPHYLVKLVLVAVILVAGRLLAGLVRAVVARSVNRTSRHVTQLLRATIVALAYNAVLGLALVIALWELGISLGPMLAGLGVAGFIVGFAMQDSLSNFVAGMMILVYRPYDVGDQVEVAGIVGKVASMSMVSTGVLTFDNQKLVVPNSKIWGDVIKNVTDQSIRRVDLTFGISYSDDIARAETILADILAKHDHVLAEPAPVVRLHKLGESSVDFVVRPWVKTEDYWDVYWDVTRAVKMRFDVEGISIPFPQRDVHVHGAQAPVGARENGGRAADGSGGTSTAQPG